jgi:hypothetical protein
MKPRLDGGLQVAGFEINPKTGRQHIAQGFLTIVQHKTKAKLTIPVQRSLMPRRRAT